MKNKKLAKVGHGIAMIGAFPATLFLMVAVYNKNPMTVTKGITLVVTGLLTVVTLPFMMIGFGIEGMFHEDEKQESSKSDVG